MTMRHKMIAGMTAAMILAAAAGSVFAQETTAPDTSQPAEELNMYTGNAEDIMELGNTGYSMEIPEFIRKNATIQTEGLDKNTIVKVSETASLEANEKQNLGYDTAGWIFSISKAAEDEVKQLRCDDMSGCEVFAQDGNGTFYLLGHCGETGAFTEESDHAVDYGIDFYAPQTVLTPDGRRVMIGWMQNWDTCNLHTRWVPWFGQMSLPRELSVRNGILYQTPVRELETLRGEEVRHEHVLIEDSEIRLPGVHGRTVDLELEIEPEGPLFNRFAIRFAQNELYHTTVSFRPHESVLKIDRKFSGSRRAIIHQRRAKVRHDGGRLKLRLILDRFSAEVFVNDGEQVLSATVSTDLSAEGISFFADGAVRINVLSYRLGS